MDREAKLKETDYVAAKIAEGAATPKEYAEVLAKRQQERVDINNAQAEIDELNKTILETEDVAIHPE